jgi:putative transposase
MEDAPVTMETVAKKEPEPVPARGVVDQQLVAELVARASAEGVSLTGEGGLLAQLTKLVLESSLEGEMMPISVMPSTIRPAAPAGTRATAAGPKRW